MSNDEETYHSPELFIPERFLPSEKAVDNIPTDPRVFVFGVGRRFVFNDRSSIDVPSLKILFSSRICPGMHFGELSVISIMITLLAAVNIVKDVDADGVEIPVIGETTGGLSK